MNSGFFDKLIERIGRVRPEEVQNYLHRLADEGKGLTITIRLPIRQFRARMLQSGPSAPDSAP